MFGIPKAAGLSTALGELCAKQEVCSTDWHAGVQAGRPKTITGFQTHTTPVLLSVGDRAELATNKYLPLTSVLEGLVILKENPDYIETNE